MMFAGALPEDAPDPRVQQRELLQRMPVPVLGIVPQPSLEDFDILGIESSQTQNGFSDMSVSISYTLWRNPNDKSDPVNLADLEEHKRQAIEQKPSQPRPAWADELVTRMLYPQLWEAVKTTWYFSSAERTTVGKVLVSHVNHILRNSYWRERGVVDFFNQPGTGVSERSLRSGVLVSIDGQDMPGVEIDTDPFVYGVGAELANGSLLTAVLPRDELDLIHLAFSGRDSEVGLRQ